MRKPISHAADTIFLEITRLTFDFYDEHDAMTAGTREEYEKARDQRRARQEKIRATAEAILEAVANGDITGTYTPPN